MRKSIFQLLQLSGGTMDFKADEVCHLHRCSEHLSHVVEVLQERFGVDVTFAAEDLVAVDRKLVEKIAGFVPRLRREFRQDRLEMSQFLRRNFEVGMETDKSREPIHTAERSEESSLRNQLPPRAPLI